MRLLVNMCGHCCWRTNANNFVISNSYFLVLDIISIDILLHFKSYLNDIMYCSIDIVKQCLTSTSVIRILYYVYFLHCLKGFGSFRYLFTKYDIYILGAFLILLIRATTFHPRYLGCSHSDQRYSRSYHIITLITI